MLHLRSFAIALAALGALLGLSAVVRASEGLVSFTAEYTPAGIALRWVTGSERNTVGFHIMRTDNAADFDFDNLDANGNGRLELSEITPWLITDPYVPAEGNPSQGASYVYLDANVAECVIYHYKLIQVRPGDEGIRPLGPPDYITEAAGPLCYTVKLPIAFKPAANR